MTDEPLKTLISAHSARYTDRGSRFYAYAFPVMDLEEIEIRRSRIADKHRDASHQCYAWRYNPSQPEEFVQDDGEPAGTAGQPILGVIKSALLVNVLIIVVRYFGGTKLGKSGLVRAYREAAALSIASAEKMNLDRFIPFRVLYPYEQENRIRELINRYRMDIAQETYLENISITFYCKADQAAELEGILEHLAYLGIFFEKKPECFRQMNGGTPN